MKCIFANASGGKNQREKKEEEEEKKDIVHDFKASEGKTNRTRCEKGGFCMYISQTLSTS